MVCSQPSFVSLADSKLIAICKPCVCDFLNARHCRFQSLNRRCQSHAVIRWTAGYPPCGGHHLGTHALFAPVLGTFLAECPMFIESQL
jgi:hypothetical protein